VKPSRIRLTVVSCTCRLPGSRWSVGRGLPVWDVRDSHL